MGKYDSLIDEEVGAKPAPTTPQEANYGALIDEELSSAPLHSSLFNTAGTNPDDEAKKRKLAKELNTPAAILPNDAEQQVQLKKLDADVIKSTAPASAQFLTNEDNAKVTGLNGVDKLVEMERAYKTYNPANIKKYIENYTSTGKPAAEAVQRLSEMKKQGVDLTKELDPYARSTADYFKDPIKAAAGGANIMAAGFVELGRIAPNPVGALMSALSPAYAEARRNAYDTVQQQLNDNVEYWQGRKSPAMQKLVDDFGKAGVADSVMMLIANPSLAVDQLSQSTPYMLPGAAAARGGAGAMATFNAFIEAADAANTARQEAIKNGQSLEQQDRSAMIAAVTTAPLAFLGNKLTGTAAFEADFFTKGSTGQKLLDAVVKEAISGAVEEGSNQLGVNIGAAQYDDNRQILEGVGKAMVIGGLLESTHAVGMTAAERALRTFIKDTENVTNLVAESNTNAAQAVAAHDTIEQLSAMTADNDLRTRAPEAFQEFIETMTEGEDLQEVYVDGATALEAIKNNYTDLIRTQPELFARIQEAAGLGHDVQFTVGEYLTYFAGKPIEKTVLPMLKSEPGGATYQEAQEFYNKQAELFQSEVQAVAEQNEPVLSREEFEAMRAPDSAYNGDLDEGLTRIFTHDEFTGDPVELTGVGFTQDEIAALEQVGQATNGTMTREQYGAWLDERSNRLKPIANRTGTYEEYVAQHNNKREVYAKDVEAVEATLFNEMQKAGRFTSSVNRAYVAPLVEFYKTQAKNFGIMPSEMYAKYPLKVQAFLGLLPSATELQQYDMAAPLEGAPSSSLPPNDVVRGIAKKYAEQSGITSSPQVNYVKADPVRGKRIADEYEAMEHKPNDPEVKAAYRALIDETLAQYQLVKELGLNIEFIEQGQADPYPEGPRQAIEDIRNGHLWVFPTDSGFGSSDQQYEGNPLLEVTKEKIGDRVLLANDVFRIVHDVFGHAKDGVGFGANGEENAWQSHVRMYSPLAARAMTTETRGQNSWVNFGPFGEANRADPRNTTYADQKTGLLPEWVSTEGIDNPNRVTPEMVGSLSQLNKLQYNPALRRGELLPPTAEELALREQVVALSQAEGVEWSKAFEASMASAEANLDEKVRQVFDAMPATKSNLLRTMVQAGIAAGGTFDMETSAEWSDYRKARAKTQDVERRAQAMYFERIGPPENESMPRDREQIKTQAFKEWFGNSKVVASDGTPLIAYHGTGADITRFNTLLSETKVLANPNWTGQLGSWFAAPSDWNDYEEGNAEATADVFANDTGAIYPVYLSIKNPMEYEGYEDLQDDIGASDPIALKTRLKAEGFDGIVVRGSDTDGGQIRDDWVAFDPTQIKSAIGNIGTFDPTNPSIVNQGAAKVGQVSVRGVHFSKEKRATLNGGYYGTGIKGAEGERVRSAKDSRIKQRLYFYVDEGKGVFPEYGVGNAKHVVDLPNMYDGARNPLKLPTRDTDGNRDMNVFESAVIDAGFDGYYVESAFGRQGAAVLLGDASRNVKPLSEAVVNQSIYYSQLTRSVAALKQNKGTVEQWKGIIKNLPGVKVDEIEAVGINEWLDLQEGSVTKEDIIGYLDANGVQVEEVVLGAYNVTDRDGVEDTYVTSKYPTYVVGGENAGENYREILLTLPEKERPSVNDTARTLFKKGFNDLDPQSQNIVREKVRALDAETTYKSSHFDQRNILAHVRVDERVDPEGNRVLFVNEIQSDWAQEGKKKGFIERYKAEDVKAIYPTEAEGSQPDVFWYFEVPDNVLQIPKARYATEADAFKYVLTEKQTKSGATTPKGPFVQKTDAWVALAVKRILRYAADQGMDKVAIVSGQQAADLYDLSKRISVVSAVRGHDGLFVIGAFDNDGRQVTSRQGVARENLSDLVGKDLAEKIAAQKTGEAKQYRGLDLKVGGEGMRTFYDQIIPKVAKDVLKKLGAQPEIVSVIDEEPDADKYRIVLPNGKVVHTTNYKESAEANLMFFEGARIEEYTPDVMRQVGVTITPELKAKVQSGLPLFQGTRGSFNLDTLTMTLLQGSDLSTVIHESGHFYLEMLEKLANTTDAPQQVQDDYAKTMEWFGLTSAQWAQMSLEQKRPYHEQWAESFERWNLEGKAPTQGLQPIFSRFRAWLLSVYKSVEEFVRLNPGAGKLNDEVRGVFSRLLASAEAIEATEQARAYQPLFASAEQAGVSQNAYDDYVNLGKQATQDAVDSLQARSLRDMKWLTNARNKALKDLQATAKATRAKVLTEVTEQVTSEPIYQAMRFLRTGETKAPNGDTIKAMQGYKLDKAIIAEMFPESALDRPDLTKLRGMTSEQGLDPDIVAKMFGLPSGDALVREIVTAENMRDKIQGLTDQRMLEEHGDLVDDKSLQRAADEAVHNEARAKFMATGLKMLSNSPISVTQMVKAAKQAAENVIANKRVRDVKPKQYTAAESRANKDVLKLAAKDPAQAAEKQRVALLNNRLAAAAQDAVAEVEKALRYLGKFNNEGTRKNLDIDYLEQIDALLEPFDLRKGLSLSTIDARTTLAEWVQNQEAMGFEPTIDPVAMAEARQKSYKNMTMTELRGLVDTIKQIEHMGRMKKKLLTAIEKAEFAERIAEAKASMALNANRVVPEKGTPSDVTGQLGQWVRQMFASHRKFTSFMRELDGGQNNGVLFNLLVRPMAVAGNTETEMKAQAAERLATLFQPIMKTMSTFGNLYARRRLVPGTNISLTHEQRIMFAMNWGNEGNRQRLLDGGITGKKAMSEAEAQAVLDTLTKEEWDFVQGVWDYIAEYRPLIAEQERMLTGKTPEWVEPAEVVTKFGTYKGGYFPAKYDTVLSTRSDALEAVADLRSAMKGAFGSAAARNGYTKARAAQVVGRPLLLNFNAVSRHVNEVIHRLAWQAWLVDAARVSRALDNDFRTYLGAEATKEIQDAIRDIAQGDAPATGPFEVFLNRIRTGTSIVGMGWKITTAMLQPTGLSQSMARVGGRHMAKALARYVASPLDSSDWVNENSVLMRNRGRTMNREMNEILNTVREGKKTSAVTASFFYLVGKLQRTVDVPTFIGAYEKSLEDQQYESAASEAERKRIEATAIAVAEQTVIDTQGGGELKDLAKVQRGSPIYKLFTNFYSYMSTVYNLNVENYRTKNLLNPSELGIFAAEALLINFVPVVMAVALKNLVKGSCDWDDMECLAERYTSEQISHLFGQMVGLREIGVSVDALTGGEAFGYTGPAGLRFFVDVYKSAEQINQGEADMALFKSVNNTLGALFHYPAGQINATVDGAIAIENGEVEGAAILPALIAGAPK